jgi:hypothetical protein
MATHPRAWLDGHRKLISRFFIGILLAIVCLETFLIYQTQAVNRAAHAQSSKLLATFLSGDTAKVREAGGVNIRLQNVRFKWSENVFIDAGGMAIRAVPIQGKTVNFDDPGSYALALQQSDVFLRPSVLQGMLNESVFNYPGSKVRDLKAQLIEEGGKNVMMMTGSANMGFWFPFNMLATMSVDHATNTLVLSVERLKVLGIIPATRVLKLKPFHLDKIIALPPNNSMLVKGNDIMVKPFGLFPPPRVTGTLSDVSMDTSGIHLRFAGKPIPAPAAAAGNGNYVYLKGGSAEFGNFIMLSTDILITDKNPSSLFSFSVLHYADEIPRSNIDVHNTRAVRVAMPDF